MSELSIGLDEVGRGAFAGPVVVGAVVLPQTQLFSCEIKNSIPGWTIDGITIRDSKLLSKPQRERANEWIIKNAISFETKKGSVKKINNRGIVPATNFAFRSAIKSIVKHTSPMPQKLLIDAFCIPDVDSFPRDKQQAIIHGDRLNVSIAAASIIAKVYRDYVMEMLGKNNRYTLYSWGKNKGYGTQEHISAIKKYGTTKHHRKLYVRNCLQID